MADLDPALLETGRQIVRDWSESEGKGLALSIIIAKALQSEGDRRAEEMQERCAEVCRNVTSSTAAERVIRSLPLETAK